MEIQRAGVHPKDVDRVTGDDFPYLVGGRKALETIPEPAEIRYRAHFAHPDFGCSNVISQVNVFGKTSNGIIGFGKRRAALEDKMLTVGLPSRIGLAI